MIPEFHVGREDKNGFRTWYCIWHPLFIDAVNLLNGQRYSHHDVSA